MDTLRLSRRRGKDGEYEYEVVEIAVNGRNLIDLLRQVELPVATREGNPEIAGSYEGLPPDVVFFPSRHLLDRPNPPHGGEGHVTILECGNCGTPACWPFQVRILLDEATVTWCDFSQPHRAGKWTYDALPEFIFDRRQYEAELGWLADRE
jgi:hypothetical protein